MDLFKIGDELTHKDRDGIIYTVGQHLDHDSVYIYWVDRNESSRMTYSKRLVNEFLQHSTWINLTTEKKEVLKDKIRGAIECGKSTDWCTDNDENEYEIDTFDIEIALQSVLDVLREEKLID